MVDLATIEQQVSNDIDVVEPVANAVIPAIASLPGLGWLSFIWNAVKAIKNATGKATPAAIAELVAHNTPGMPNSDALKP